MNIIIASHNLSNQNLRYMPWRTVCEIAGNLREEGCKTVLVSLGQVAQKICNDDIAVEVYEIRKTFCKLKNDLQKITNQASPHVLFWPLTWREKKIRTTILQVLY